MFQLEFGTDFGTEEALVGTDEAHVGTDEALVGTERALVGTDGFPLGWESARTVVGPVAEHFTNSP